jgi:uncharacterized protein YacL
MNKLLQWVLAALGAYAGYRLAAGQQFALIPDPVHFGSYALPAAGAIAGYAIGVLGVRLTEAVTDRMISAGGARMLAGLAGMAAGLILAALLYPVMPLFGSASPAISAICSLMLGYMGFQFGFRHKVDWNMVSQWRKAGLAAEPEEPTRDHKILDTSVIIDGRIADICKTRFIEGTLVIPEFVLEELQHIADSSDLLKRNRGRRGLDILNKIQKELDVKVLIYEGDFDDIHEVDSKLVKLAKMLKGKVVTNDYNLNKVCELQGVEVLNINDLANAVKPVVLPGEEIVVHVIKDGKEYGQGVAYLDDGTMIVVEGGRDYIGETVEVLVTSVLQTSAGRMIFAKPKLLEKAL